MIARSSAAAALKVTQPGGRAGIPTWEALTAFVKAQA